MLDFFSGLRYKGFEVADTASPYFELLYLPFEQGADKPRFRDCVKAPGAMSDGFTLYYTSQCPFTAKYVPLLEEVAKQKGVAMKAVHIGTKEEAQNAPCPFTTFALFYEGEFVTHEILSESKFEKLISEKGL